MTLKVTQCHRKWHYSIYAITGHTSLPISVLSQ